MAVNQTSTNYESVCEKICKVICCSPQSSNPTSPVRTVRTEAFSAEVPVNNVMGQGHNQAARVAPNNEVVPTRGRKAAPLAKLGQGEEGNGDGKLFSEYIDRAKVKIRTTSSVGGGGVVGGGGGDGVKSVGRLDSFHDRVTNYLNRARIKIRTTSNVGSRRSVSIE